MNVRTTAKKQLSYEVILVINHSPKTKEMWAVAGIKTNKWLHDTHSTDQCVEQSSRESETGSFLSSFSTRDKPINFQEDHFSIYSDGILNPQTVSVVKLLVITSSTFSRAEWIKLTVKTCFFYQDSVGAGVRGCFCKWRGTTLFVKNASIVLSLCPWWYPLNVLFVSDKPRKSSDQSYWRIWSQTIVCILLTPMAALRAQPNFKKKNMDIVSTQSESWKQHRVQHFQTAVPTTNEDVLAFISMFSSFAVSLALGATIENHYSQLIDYQTNSDDFCGDALRKSQN